VRRGIDRRRARAGFTVVEMLVALTLFSMLCTLLFGNIRFGLMAWQHGQVRAEGTDHTLVVQDLLRRIIGELYPLFVTDDPTHPHVEFVGTENSVAFIGPAPIVAGQGTRYRYRLWTDQHGPAGDLVMTSLPELAANPSSSVLNPLMTDVERVEISYFGRMTSDLEARWHGDWPPQGALPQLVRVQVRFHAGDARSWPELIVSPRISADVNCRYDALTKRCQGR
jgi:general secretion pathway protein J